MEPLAKGSEARRPRGHTTAMRPRGAAQPRTSSVTAKPQTRALPARIEGLDGLRAASILIVLLGHAALAGNAPALLWPLRDLGLLGVYLFFGISGFIITLLMLRERQRTGGVSLSGFWRRRALRILPPFAAACAGIAAGAACGLLDWHWHSFLSALSFTTNLHFYPGDWFFGHFWSLSMEEQFYLLWPLLFLPLVHARRAAGLMLALVLASPLLALGGLLLPPHLLNVLPCLPYLSAGCLLAILLHGRPEVYLRLRARRGLRRAVLWLLPLCALAASCYKRDGQTPVTATFVEGLLMPPAVFLLVAESVLEDGLLRGALSWAPLRWIGLASYSIYLWQQLFLGPPEVYRRDWFWAQWPQNILAAVACGALAYLLVERPASALKRVLERRTRPAAAQSTATGSRLQPAAAASAARRSAGT